MKVLKKRRYLKFAATVLSILLLSGLFCLMPSTDVFADSSASLEITGDGVATPLTLTMEELMAMEQHQQVYSVINTWPTKKWYIGKGVRLRELLALAGIKEEARLIRFISFDGYEVTLTVKELLEDKRYYFPGLKENHAFDGSIPGSSEGAVEAEPILALKSAEGSDNPDHMNTRDSLLLMIGQRSVIEQTNNLFLKYTRKIEVLTAQPERWDNPRANIPDGTVVPVGTNITLRNKRNNEDKIHFTTDGSIPTVNSPMFNWTASRWWISRPDVHTAINKPIEVKEDTVIKMITIGPGKEDSEVVTFRFTADMTGKAVDPTKIPGGPPTGVTLDQTAINRRVGSTFQLEATVAPFNADNKDVVWSSSDTRVATVDHSGLVTVVGPGTAVITVKTADGNFTATAVINPAQQEQEQAGVPVGTDPQEIELQLTPSELQLSEGTQNSPSAETVPAPVENMPEEPALEQQAVPEELPVPEGNWQHLAEKASPDRTADADILPGQSGVQPLQIFEVWADTIPLPLEEKKDMLNIYAALAFLILFISGAGRKYAEYLHERS